MGKGHKPATIPLPVPVLRAVHDTVGDRQSGPILLNTRGQRMSPAAATTRLHRLARAVGIDHPVSPHSLRRTFCTAGLISGVSMVEPVATSTSSADCASSISSSPAGVLASRSGSGVRSHGGLSQSVMPPSMPTRSRLTARAAPDGWVPIVFDYRGPASGRPSPQGRAHGKADDAALPAFPGASVWSLLIVRRPRRRGRAQGIPSLATPPGPAATRTTRRTRSGRFGHRVANVRRTGCSSGPLAIR